MDDYIKRPRLYVDNDLRSDQILVLEKKQAHYLKNVMRLTANETIRLFNGRHGEWLATLDLVDKKTAQARINVQLREQKDPPRAIHLFFAPIKKARMDFLIEKSVELGATHLHPILTEHTEVRKINAERIKTQIIEAAEQCERLDIPVLEGLQSLPESMETYADQLLYACMERGDFPYLTDIIEENGDIGFLIGPEGGFNESEKELLSTQGLIKPVSLGMQVLRSETAALCALAQASPIISD